MGELDGKVALVTGASRGIGAAVARRLAAEGAAVALAARSLDAAPPQLPGTLRETLAAIEKLGGRGIALAVDLLDAGDRARLVEQVRAELGPVDVLVNNAAAAFYLPFADVGEKRFRVAFEVNVRAPFDLAQRVVPEMRARGGGWIVNVSSASARHPEPPYGEFAREGGATLYAASKAALDRISTGLAAELSQAGIAVNSLSPVAAVLTPGVLALGVVPEAFRESAEPVECLAEAVLALCVPREPPITGRILFSRPLLAELGRPVRTLDGRAPFAGA